MREFIAGTNDSGVRADVFVASQYPSFTRSSLERLFDEELVSLDGRPAKPAQKINAGDRVKVDEKYLRKAPPKIQLPIIYEDDDVLVINKPVGILTHSKGALNLEGTVASFIKPKTKGLNGNRAGIVHRLDRATSGVIICAKNPQALATLQRQFSRRKVRKVYEAIVEGELKPKKAIIEAPIRRNPNRPQTFQVAADGRPATTEYEVEKVFERGNELYSQLLLRPKTGRTHQLRVHLKHVGHPIVGDMVYGHGAGEMLLHAKELELTLPGGNRQVFSAPTPTRFTEFIDA